MKSVAAKKSPVASKTNSANKATKGGRLRAFSRWCINIISPIYSRICELQDAQYKKRRGKFISDQLTYHWEMYHNEKTVDRSMVTFDLLSPLSLFSRLRVIFFVMMMGAFIGLASTCFQYSEYFSHHYFEELEHYISHHYHIKWWIYVHWTLGATIGGLFCGYVAKVYLPECSGAGADAVKICMAVKAPVPLFVGFFRIILSSIYLGMGNPLGTEAPTLHVTAAVASSFLRLASKLLPDEFRLEHLPTWVLVGMTAGLAAAFVAPLAGMLYAVEEFMNLRKIGLSIILIGVASTVASMVSVIIRRNLDPSLGIHLFHKDVLRVNFSTDLRLSLGAMIIAVVCASMALLFAKAALSLRLFNNKIASKYVHPRFFGGIASFVIGCVGCATYVATHSHGSWSIGVHHYGNLLTQPSCEEASAHYHRYESVSHPGNFHLLSSLSHEAHGSQYVLTHSHDCISWDRHLAYIVGRSVMVTLAVSVGGPGGIFFPALLLGGSVGAVFSGWSALYDPEHADSYRVFIILGMVGLFSALIRTPVTAILVTYEMSGYSAIGLVPGLTFNMILTSVVAFLIVEHMDHLPFVEKVMVQDGIDFHDLFYQGLAKIERDQAAAAESGEEHAKTASYRILVEAANRAHIEQKLADNIWMLRLASQHNVKGMHEHLLRGARVDMNWIHHGLSCLQICIDNDLENAVRLLLFKKANPELIAGNPPISPLVRACRRGLKNAGIALIAYGAIPSRQDASTLEYPICAAAASGNKELVMALVQGNASMAVTNQVGESPLVIAARNRHQKLVTVLTAYAWKERHKTYDDSRKRVRRGALKHASSMIPSNLSNEEFDEPTKDNTNGDDQSSFCSRMSLGTDENEEDALEEEHTLMCDIGWFQEDGLIVRTWKDFLKELRRNIGTFHFIWNDREQKELWGDLRKRCAIYQIKENHLIRHLSLIEIHIYAFIGNTDQVLMEHSGTVDNENKFPMYMNDSVEHHADWHTLLEEGLMQLFGFTLAFINLNLVEPLHSEEVSTTTEKTNSKLVVYETIRHKHIVSLEVANPNGTAVMEEEIGLPVGEQFVRDGKRYTWRVSSNKDTLRDALKAESKAPTRSSQIRRDSFLDILMRI